MLVGDIVRVAVIVAVIKEVVLQKNGGETDRKLAIVWT